MALFDDLGVDHMDPDAIERGLSGELLPKGLYATRLVGAKSLESKNKGTPGTELTFEIIAGPHTGAVMRETIWITSNEASQNRRILFAHRLGLLQVVQVGDKKRYAAVEGKSDWIDAYGTAVVIAISQQPKQDKTGKEIAGEFRNVLEFGGIYNLDSSEKRVVEFLKVTPIPKQYLTPSEPGEVSATPPSAGRGFSAAATSRGPDLSDL